MMKFPDRILLVDDEKDFVDLLALKLKEVGKEVQVAYDGRECLDALEKDNIDVVILDIKMPGMDGIDVLKEIKRRFAIVEVIMLTGHGTIQTAVEGMKLGAFDYLLKPTDFEDLLSKVENARRRKEAHEERIRKAEAEILLKESRKLRR
ncbi:MAG: response regulator [Deltaproteobacteria bacterium]|jgi:DNA-binding NtrC family response regulator